MDNFANLGWSKSPASIIGIFKSMKIHLILLLFLCYSVQGMDFDRLASAIRVEEGANPRWLYGVHHKSHKPLGEAEARNRCIATCKSVWRVWDNAGRKNSYFTELGRSYCPVNSASWSKNVKWIYENKKK